jgi:hypothetical protein
MVAAARRPASPPGLPTPNPVHDSRTPQPQAGAAGVHFEDQLASAKKCGHLGGKVRRAPPRAV